MFKKLLLITFFIISSYANTLKIGDTLPAFTLPDQFDKKHTIDTQKYTTFIISFEKDVSAMVNEFLKNQPDNFLEANKTVYISDIHKMPSFVTSWFALPKMKEYNYILMLMYEENPIFPQHEEAVTVIKFQDDKIYSIDFIKEANNLQSIFH